MSEAENNEVAMGGEGASEMEEGYGNENDGDDDIFRNNHDLIGVQGILQAQKTEIEQKKLELRMENERYFRQHPEINYLLQLFVSRILDDRPENILEYAGTFFDSASLREMVEKYTKKEIESAEKQNHLSDLIKGKTLI